MASRALVVGGLTSGSGKTTVTLGLLRALASAGHSISAAKTGPDYIDSAFLGAAALSPAINLDSHAMTPEMVRHLAAARSGKTLIVEGVMGLFDGTDGGSGSTAQLAATLGAPIILVLDTRHQGQTAAALAAGIKSQLPAGTELAGVVLNRVASPRHEALIVEALTQSGIPHFGSLATTPSMEVPSRHLGLVQAADLAAMGELEPRIEAAAGLVGSSLNLDSVIAAAGPLQATGHTKRLPPPGQHIAVANDIAFGFAYTHMLEGWRAAGAGITPFSPLADEAPSADADFIFLPGGYPELHLSALTNAGRFHDGLRAAASRGVRIYGECGGFMTLGEAIIDADGTSYPMAGILRLETSFAARKLHLGYRGLTPLADFWPGLGPVTGHEFHYTTAITAEGEPLFQVRNAAGTDISADPGAAGLVNGSVCGSYSHIIA
jgi:cobyrinic acid a,c-diamide synthase